jgi:hypothetical protein
MPDIFHDFPIKAPPDRVFEAVSTPTGLDAWWSKKSSGRQAEGAEYQLWFGPQYDWRARVTKSRGKRALADLMLLLGPVSEDPAEVSRTWRIRCL